MAATPTLGEHLRPEGYFTAVGCDSRRCSIWIVPESHIVRQLKSRLRLFSFAVAFECAFATPSDCATRFATAAAPI